MLSKILQFSHRDSIKGAIFVGSVLDDKLLPVLAFLFKTRYRLAKRVKLKR